MNIQHPDNWPFAVRDDTGKAWSSHLAGPTHAWLHYKHALKAGVQNPTITNRGGDDITEDVRKMFSEKEP